MSDQSDAPVSTEPSDHVIVRIPPEQPDHISRKMDLYRWCESWLDYASQVYQRELERLTSFQEPYFRDPSCRNFHLLESRANQSEHGEDEDTPASPGLRFPPRFWDPSCRNFHLLESRANQRERYTHAFSLLNMAYEREDEDDLWNLSDELIEEMHALLNQHETREVGYDGQFRHGDAFGFNVDLRASQANQREHILMNSWTNTVSFRQALQRVHQARRSVELTIGQVRRLESCVLSFEDFGSLALPRQQTREVWYDGWNRRPGDRYTVIGLISTISCAIYSILFGLTGQMYKEEDGSFFSHHRVMVTISMLSMVYAAFSGVFLCVIYYLATADPTHTYRRRMRFLSGTFFSAACFGPAVMFMAMFVGPLGFKVFAWAILGAALTRVGFYIGG